MKQQVSGPKHSSEAGFTLIESLIAIIVLVFGLIAIANLFALATSSNSVANVSTAAATVASERMERLKALPFTDLVPGGDLANDDADYHAYTEVPGAGRIRTRWLIETVGGNVNQITVTAQGASPSLFSGERTQARLSAFRSCTVCGCNAGDVCTDVVVP